VPQRVETVQVETAQELGRIAQTFNQASHESLRIAFQQFAANGDSLGLVMELITRLQAHGLDPDRISNFIVDVPTEMRGNASPSRLQLVASASPNDLLAEPEGVGEQSYVSRDQSISYTIRFENPAEALTSVQDITLMLQLGPGIDMKSIVSSSSSHPSVMSVSIDELRNTVTWVFNDINLLTEQEFPRGQGWVRFSVDSLSMCHRGP
jgi:hypothetical protein